MIYWKFKYSRTQRALDVGVSVEKFNEIKINMKLNPKQNNINKNLDF